MPLNIRQQKIIYLKAVNNFIKYLKDKVEIFSIHYSRVGEPFAKKSKIFVTKTGA